MKTIKLFDNDSIFLTLILIQINFETYQKRKIKLNFINKIKKYFELF